MRIFGKSISLSKSNPCKFLQLLKLMDSSNGSLFMIFSKYSVSNCTQLLMSKLSSIAITAVAFNNCVGRMF